MSLGDPSICAERNDSKHQKGYWVKMQSEHFDLFSYFTGNKRAYGLFQDRFGVVRRRFIVDILGTVEGETLKLEERFSYDDGEREQRTWWIERLGDTSFSGCADDVIGKAQGEISGATLHWRYRMNLKMKRRSINVDFDDWMFLMPDQVLLNRAEVRKFNILLGTVFISFKPLHDEDL